MNPILESCGHLEGVGREQPRPIDEICSASSDSSTPNPTTTRWNETFTTRVASSHSTCRKNAAPIKEDPPGGDLKVGREKHCCPRSECTSEGRHRGACFSEDAGGSLVDRKHERAKDRRSLVLAWQSPSGP